MKIKKKYILQKTSENNKKPMKCIACNGTGRYDHNGSPKCASCDRTGLEKTD